MFVSIVEDDRPFDWSPVDEESGETYESVFQLRIVDDDTDKVIRKRHTRQVFDKKLRRTVDQLELAGYLADVIDFAIVGWTKVKNARTGDELACTAALKTRLPEKWKAEIL